MQITCFKIRNFRSIWSKNPREKSFTIDLSSGINYLVGPNNTGKSNILRALELAFHDTDGSKFDMSTDNPSVLTYSRPTFEIHFQKNTSHSSENTLFKYAKEYEDNIRNGESTFAEKDELRWIVKYSKSGRDDSFAISGVGGRKGKTELIEKIRKQLLSTCHFIYVPSGQGIEELFKGAFQNILKSVLEEHLGQKLKEAKESKDKYLETIKKDLLNPLQEILSSRLKNVIPEIKSVEVIPSIPDVDKQIAQAAIRIKDHFESELKFKGTGVRSTTLIALLNYIREHSNKSIIFALEEPETFLHPGAQSKIIGELERLADRKDVTMLVTTHSPFILSKKDNSRIHKIRKNHEGLTICDDFKDGQDGVKDSIGPLFDDSITPLLISKLIEYDSTKRGFILVEGYTDQQYISLACEKKNRSDLISDLQIISCEGAGKTVLKAAFLKSILPRNQQNKIPLFILLDWDKNGMEAYELLKGNTFGFRNRQEVTTYREFKMDRNDTVLVEAEDLFSNNYLDSFLQQFPSYESERQRRHDGEFHYGLTDEGKKHFLEFIKNQPPSAFDNWINLIKEIRLRLGLDNT